LLSTAYHKHL